MLRNFLLIALRNFRRQQGFTLLNITGLAMGLCSVMLIYLFILDETGFDRFHSEAENVYLLGVQGKVFSETEVTSPYSPGAWVKALTDQYPEVAAVTQLVSPGFPASFRNPAIDRIVLSERFYLTTPSFKDVLYFPLLQGNRETALRDANSLVLSAAAAQRLFGEQNPVGKTVQMKHLYLSPDRYLPLTVTGVMADYPANSHLTPDYLMNVALLRPLMQSANQDWLQNWGGSDGWFNSYVRLQEGASAQKITRSFNKLIQKHVPTTATRSVNAYLLPLPDLHFNQPLRSSYLRSGDVKYLYIFATTAVLVILMASINYVNLATARAQRRGKEIGLRKVLGSNRKQLMAQFLGESLVTTLVAVVVAFFLASLLLPAFNSFAAKHFTLGHLLQGKLLLALLGTTLLVALLSGSYPAMYLSRLQPLLALQSNRFTGRHSDWLRKGLVGLQYSVTLLLVVTTGIMLQQMDFINRSALSEGGHQMLSIRYSGVASLDKYRLFKQLLRQDPELETVTMATHLPYYEFTVTPQEEVTFPELGRQSRQWATLNGDYDFPAAFDLELLAGRSFKAGNSADSNAYLLNESAVKALGIPLEKVVGLSLQTKLPWQEAKDYKHGQVIGVVRDFPYQSVHQRISPLMINGRPDRENQIIYVKLPKEKVAEKIAGMEKTWKQVLPGEGFDYWFLSQEYGRVYETENRMAALFKSFSVLSILIACLGLFGLSSYQAERRQKEIGIRKVLGASLPEILRLLLTSFLTLLAVACLVALPVAWLLMHRWLEEFTYRVNIDALVFLTGIGLVLLLTAASVGYETIRAALANPVDTLKQE